MSVFRLRIAKAWLAVECSEPGGLLLNNVSTGKMAPISSFPLPLTISRRVSKIDGSHVVVPGLLRAGYGACIALSHAPALP